MSLVSKCCEAIPRAAADNPWCNLFSSHDIDDDHDDDDDDNGNGNDDDGDNELSMIVPGHICRQLEPMIVPRLTKEYIRCVRLKITMIMIISLIGSQSKSSCY